MASRYNLKTKFLSFLLTLLFLSMTAQLSAQDTFTLNTTGGDWNTSTDWTIVRDGDNGGSNTYPGESAANQSPDGADVVIIPTGTDVTLDANVPAAVGSISITSTGQMDIASFDISVVGDVTGTGTITISTGTFSVGGSLGSSATALATLTSSGAAAISVGGDYNLTAFTPSTSDVTFDGSGAQSIISGSDPDFDDLIVDKSGGTLTANQALNIANNLTVSNGTFDLNGQTVDINGDLTVNATLSDGTFATARNTTVAGNLSVGTSGTLNYVSILFDGTSPQISGDGTIQFFTLEFNVSGTASNTAATINFNSLIITGGTLQSSNNWIADTYSGGSSFEIISVESGGTLSPQSNSEFVFDINRQASVPFNTSTGVITNSSANATITFHNIDYSSNNTGNTLSFNDDAGGATTFQINGTFDLKGSAKGGISTTNSSITYGSSGTLTYSVGGTVDADAWPASNGPSFVNINSGTVTLTASRSIDSSLTMDGGSFTIGGTLGSLTMNSFSLLLLRNNTLTINSGRTLTVNGTLEMNGGTLTDNSGGNFGYGVGPTGDLKYSASTAQTVGNEWTNSVNPQDVTITNTNNVNLGSANRSIRNLTLSSAELRHSGTLTISGNVTASTGIYGVTDNGTLNATGASSQVVASGELTLYNFTMTSSSGTIGGLTINNLLTINSSGTVTVDDEITLSTDADLTISGGTLNFAGRTITPGGGTNTLTVNSGTELRTGGTSLSGFTLSASTGTIEFSGSGAQETLPSGVTIGTLEINNSAGVATSSGTLTINTSLDLQNGVVTTTASNILLLDTDATASGSSSSYVDGPLRKQYSATGSFTFHIGSGSDYRPAIFNYTGGTFGGTSTIEVEHSTSTFDTGNRPSGISSIATATHYIVTPGGTDPTNPVFSFTGTYEDGNFSPETRNRVLVQSGPTPDWTVGTTTVSTDIDTINNTVLASGFNALPTDDYFVAFGSAGIPITWDGGATGSWGTAGNWDPDGLPTSEDDVSITGNVSVDIDGSTSAEALTLTLGSGSDTPVLNVGGSSVNPLTIYSSNTNALLLENGATLEVNNSNGIKFDGSGYDETRTDFTTNSTTVEYQTSNVPFDAYHNLNINGATGATGSETITVAGNMTKSGSTNFTSALAFTVTGNYTNTLGNATYNSGLTVNGSLFTLTAGTVSGSGTITINSATVDVDGGSFGGTVNLASVDNSVGGDADPGFANLTVTSGATFTRNASVSGTLTFSSGLIDMGTNVLTLESGASLSGNDSDKYVVGAVARQAATGSKVFPIGKDGYYRPVTTNFSSAGSPTVQFEMINSSPNQSWDGGIVRISSVRYYEINVSSAAISSGTVNLSYGASDGVEEFNEANDLIVVISDDNSTDAYSSLAGSQSSGTTPDGDVTSGDVGTLSSGNDYFFTFGTISGDNSLPVTLNTFDFDVTFGSVDFSWVTSSEINNLGFNLYRADIETPDVWTLVNKSIIPGQGNSSEDTYYEFSDKSVQAGAAYLYKLESVALNGVIHVEKQIELTVPVPEEFALFDNYPNPFNPVTNFKFQLPETQNVTLLIFDTQGRKVRDLINSEYAAGEFTVQWNGLDNNGIKVSSGMYLYVMRSGRDIQSGKMILMK